MPTLYREEFRPPDRHSPRKLRNCLMSEANANNGQLATQAGESSGIQPASLGTPGPGESISTDCSSSPGVQLRSAPEYGCGNHHVMTIAAQLICQVVRKRVILSSSRMSAIRKSPVHDARCNSAQYSAGFVTGFVGFRLRTESRTTPAPACTVAIPFSTRPSGSQCRCRDRHAR